MFDVRRRYRAVVTFKLKKCSFMYIRNESNTIQFVIFRILVSKWIVKNVSINPSSSSITTLINYAKTQPKIHKPFKWIDNNAIEFYLKNKIIVHRQQHHKNQKHHKSIISYSSHFGFLSVTTSSKTSYLNQDTTQFNQSKWIK